MTGNTGPAVGFVSLGCPKATVDSERILTRLQSEGYRSAPTYEDADLVVINTCGFIDAAVEESMGTIEEALERNGRVVVTGCLGARAEQIRAAFPEVLDITGPHQYDAVLEAVHRHLPPVHDPFTSLVPAEGLKLTPRHYAYLKISEGCNHKCSFCIIPSMRGLLQSRRVSEVLDEARTLVDAGVKELLVISQDTSAYGLDLKYRPDLWQARTVRAHVVDLARELGQLGAWVRLHYVYPYPHVDDLIPLMAEGLVLPYLDVPFQHASPKILRSMRRPASAQNNLERIRAWREICPGIVIRSTFIVGFPGETEDDFETLLDFLEEARIDRAGCFEYSPVDGARANDLEGAVPEGLKRDRHQRFMELQARISEEKLEARIGESMRVLVDTVEDGEAMARGPGDAPDIDGLVTIRDAGRGPTPVAAGDWAEVIIESSDEHDLHARLR